MRYIDSVILRILLTRQTCGPRDCDEYFPQLTMETTNDFFSSGSNGAFVWHFEDDGLSKDSLNSGGLGGSSSHSSSSIHGFYNFPPSFHQASNSSPLSCSDSELRNLPRHNSHTPTSGLRPTGNFYNGSGSGHVFSKSGGIAEFASRSVHSPPSLSPKPRSPQQTLLRKRASGKFSGGNIKRAFTLKKMGSLPDSQSAPTTAKGKPRKKRNIKGGSAIVSSDCPAPYTPDFAEKLAGLSLSIKKGNLSPQPFSGSFSAKEDGVGGRDSPSQNWGRSCPSFKCRIERVQSPADRVSPARYPEDYTSVILLTEQDRRAEFRYITYISCLFSRFRFYAWDASFFFFSEMQEYKFVDMQEYKFVDMQEYTFV